MPAPDAPAPSGHGQQTSGLLRYRADRRSLLFLLVTLILLLLPLFSAPDGPAKIIWLAASTLFCFNACIINHNHIHCPTFHGRWSNEVFGHLLGLAKGHTSTGVMVAHNYNHHRYQGSEKDWIRPSLAGRGPGLLRLLRYVGAASIEMAKGRNATDAPRLPRATEKRLQRERISLWAFMLAMLWIDWANALQFVFVPWVLAMAMLTGVNLLQHDGCESSDTYRASRNFTGALGNWFFLNNGYHTAHHLQPRLHWSELRRYHGEEVANKVPETLNQHSILAFLLRHYVLAQRMSVEAV